ncbi:MAG TPA: type II toxin-antitoxin system PemK/MazF family toxin [Gemmataceae bacterium]|nr:type II toxin-antitoxin system PemK/MazF family toxin [Gemmataceae bacterium]
MTPGEIYWVVFPPSDGHEQSGRRPAIILQDARYGERLSVVLVAPVTGSLANTRFAATVQVSPTEENGLYAESVILVFQIRAMDRTRFGKRIGFVTPEVLAQVYKELDKLTGRP